ncbi:hypothetical protein [Gordonia sp. (in: high G+C Gram-positive bacteria)]|uniref:hypothetical protein n=1 Tax=Gordonia sp. (in: high G+C Gram-positive bacteria) TaxID=84139 RepID=UPI0039E32A1F
MSDSQIILVDLDVSADDAPILAERVRRWVLVERLDGVEVSVGPLVHLPVENTGQQAVCPTCDRRFDTATWIEAADPVFTAWIQGSGMDVLPCPACGAALRTHEWRWVDGEPWALGNLGVTFWNWPEPGDEHHERLRELFDGHQTCVIRAHL